MKKFRSLLLVLAPYIFVSCSAFQNGKDWKVAKVDIPTQEIEEKGDILRIMQISGQKSTHQIRMKVGKPVTIRFKHSDDEVFRRNFSYERHIYFEVEADDGTEVKTTYWHIMPQSTKTGYWVYKNSRNMQLTLVLAKTKEELWLHDIKDDCPGKYVSRGKTYRMKIYVGYSDDKTGHDGSTSESGSIKLMLN